MLLVFGTSVWLEAGLEFRGGKEGISDPGFRNADPTAKNKAQSLLESEGTIKPV